MSTPTIVTGDGWVQEITVMSGGVAYSIPSDATIKAAIINTSHTELQSDIITIVSTDEGNDWTSGIVRLRFLPSEMTSLVSGLAKVEMQVEEIAGDKATWFGPVKVVAGLIP